MKKVRVAKSETILDEVDIAFLHLLDTEGGLWPLNEIKKVLNISHKALLVHARRLIDHQFIASLKLFDGNEKQKTYGLTKTGRATIEKLYTSPRVKKLLLEYK